MIEDAEKEEKERLERVTTAFHDFKIFYLPNKLYFSKSIVGQLNKILLESWEKADYFARKQNFFKKGVIPKDDYKEYMDKMTEISEEVATKFPQMIEKIEDDFRNILGVRD